MNRNFKQLKSEYDTAWNSEFKKTGVFWAFDNDQFEENRTHKDEEGKYYSIGAGGYIHEKDIPKYKYFNRVTSKELLIEYKQKINKTDLIEYEILNREAYYTGNLSEVLEIIKSTYPKTTMSEIKRVYNKHCDFYNSLV